jgi:general secretion pathway protein G
MNAERGTMNTPATVEDNERGPRLIHRSSFIARRSKSSGFSLLELIVVVTIIGILAAIAIVNVKFATRKAREAALRDNLFSMRKAIDNYYADKQKFPASLEELVPNYIRAIPRDPITQQADWQIIMEDPMAQTESGEFFSSETDPNAMSQPGVQDVKSSAEGTTLDTNEPYSEL